MALRCPKFTPAYYLDFRSFGAVERRFSKLKQFRAVAPLSGERGHIYQGTADGAAIMIWLRDPVPDR